MNWLLVNSVNDNVYKWSTTLSWHAGNMRGHTTCSRSVTINYFGETVILICFSNMSNISSTWNKNENSGSNSGSC